MKNTKIDTGIQTHQFFDKDDHIFASFRINPTDINLAARAQEAGEFLNLEKNKELKDIQTAAALNKEIEEKISYVLGYDASDLFGEVTATTIFPNGEMWAMVVLDAILNDVQPAIQERLKKMDKAAEKYLKQYE